MTMKKYQLHSTPVKDQFPPREPTYAKYSPIRVEYVPAVHVVHAEAPAKMQCTKFRRK
jgi:hypothetical protein